jgi:hypothetical protein
MQLDVQTLSVVTVFVTALLGALLVFAGLQNRAVKAQMVWGGAYVVSAMGQGLLTTHGTMPDWISISIANELILLGAACIWAGSRMFDGRPVRPIPVLAAPGLWLAASMLPSFAVDLNLQVLLVSTLMAMLTAATAEEFWRGRAEPLMSRWPTVCALLAYAAALLARIPATLLSPILQGQSIMSGISFALIAFGTLLFTVVLAFLLLNMTKERTELQHKIASLIDPLSGVPNRRAFLDGAARLQAQQRLDPEPLAVMLFDLDRFKAINDRLGHGCSFSPVPRPAHSAPRCSSVASVARSSRRCFPSATSARRRQSPTACGAISSPPPRATRKMILCRASAPASRSPTIPTCRSHSCSRPRTRRSIGPRQTAAIASSVPKRPSRSLRRRSKASANAAAGARQRTPEA